MNRPVVLVVAGSDPCAGAGLQADLRTLTALGVYGATAMSLWTVQDTSGVQHIEPLSADDVLAQCDAALNDLPVAAVKTGALGSAETARRLGAVAATSSVPWVVDPVLRATHGTPFGTADMVRDHLVPHAALITPNLDEATALTGRSVRTVADMETAGEALRDLGAAYVLVKGGHLAEDAVDVLAGPDGIRHLSSPRVPGPSPHGTGCHLASAVTAMLARGAEMISAVEAAKRLITRWIAHASPMGRGAPLLWPETMDEDGFQSRRR